MIWTNVSHCKGYVVSMTSYVSYGVIHYDMGTMNLVHVVEAGPFLGCDQVAWHIVA